jgi:threonine aldolase
MEHPSGSAKCPPRAGRRDRLRSHDRTRGAPMIDLRSDTVTRPTPAMLEAMFAAPVGDDVYGEDETVNALQAKAAALFGVEAALFFPSGTMANQVAIKIHTQPGDEVLCGETAHIYRHEGGGIAVNAGCSVRLLPGEHGRFTADTVRRNVNRATDAHYPRTRLVAIENSVNLAGGVCWDLGEIDRIATVAAEHGLAMHLDGARLFNALVARGETPTDYGRRFETISVCLSKGLGAPVGSLLLGTRAHVAAAHRRRKVMGGGMRQAGYLAAAGLYALDHHVARLADDHARAAAIGRVLAALPWVASLAPVETNIVIFRVAPGRPAEAVVEHLAGAGIRSLAIAEGTVRLVFHLDIGDADVEVIARALRSYA